MRATGLPGHHWRRLGGRLLVAALAASLIAPVVPSGVASAATDDDSVAVTVSLDSPGTATLDAFDPALGTLTRVALSVRVDVLVQVCIENVGSAQGAMAGGAVNGRLDVQVPAGANSTVAALDASLATVSLAASNNTGDCAAGFDTAAGRFRTAVTASDATFFEQTNRATTSETLTARPAMAPFIGRGTVTVALTPNSDTELVLPAQWDTISVAQGTVQATVTYTYTAAPASTALSSTGASTARLIVIAVAAMLLGLAALLIARHRSSNQDESTTAG